MKITADEVRRIATLACLEFDAEGEARMAVEMSRILDYVDQVRGAAVGEAGAATASAEGRTRADEPAASLSVAEVARAAPRFERGHFVVPRVIGGE
ncbi:MAG: Asp-tRNA(Asn)/Glu-tRNA(Gln) amidotransferase subunit GatC [Thermoanaerobaculia bacterium]|nr:Asp-tRNA(Asn)/Glu-tRNA(Gln) amidotransferase subunit GatC [Thermoanaerobaculia bacterium]